MRFTIIPPDLVLKFDGWSLGFVPGYSGCVDVVSEKIVNAVNVLPGHLKKTLTSIVIDPSLQPFGVFVHDPDVSADYQRRCEDVAESSAKFYIASIVPLEFPVITGLVAENQFAKGKLELLVQYGFSDELVASRLRIGR